MKQLRLILATLTLLVGLGGAMAPAVVSAASSTPKQTVCQTLGSNNDCTSTPHNSVSLNHVVKAVIDVLSVVIGIAAVIMVMVGGFRYITAGGDANNVSSAKNTIIYAIVGLVVVALAQAIVQFVVNKVK